MKVNILIQDPSIPNLDDKELRLFVKACLQDFKQKLKRIIPDISIIFVTSEKMTAMNSKYRGLKKPTDVLSFSSEEDGYLGDIVLCIDEIKKNAHEFHCSVKEELKRDTLHGIMHLLGYDHVHNLQEGVNEEMFILQESMLKKHMHV